MDKISDVLFRMGEKQNMEVPEQLPTRASLGQLPAASLALCDALLMLADVPRESPETAE